MALWEEVSRDLKCLDSKASKEFNCSSCKSLAVQPRLNPSCGHHYCRPCTEKLVGKGQPCPECRADITNPVPDLYFERQMKQLKVRCLGNKNGCRWTGMLAELQDHLECCRVHVPLKWASQKGGGIAVLRKRVEAAEEKVERLEKQLASMSAVATPEFVMTKFEERKNKRISWLSPTFYSHTGGYKMCVFAKICGLGEGVGTHLCVFVVLLQGENDDHLKWPLRGAIVLEIVNHRDIVRNLVLTMSITAARVIGEPFSPLGQEALEFIAISNLSYNSDKNTEYLNNDSLTFRVMKVDVC